MFGTCKDCGKTTTVLNDGGLCRGCDLKDGFTKLKESTEKKEDQEKGKESNPPPEPPKDPNPNPEPPKEPENPSNPGDAQEGKDDTEPLLEETHDDEIAEGSGGSEPEPETPDDSEEEEATS